MSCDCALILAAGRGNRLKPLTDKIPKPLLKVGNNRLIEYHIYNLASAGVENIFINRAHLREKFNELLNPLNYDNTRLNYLDEPDCALETAGAIINAFNHLDIDRLIVVNGDIWTDYDFNAIINLPYLNKDLAHVVLTHNPQHNSLGDFSIDDNRLLNPDNQGVTYTFTGIGIYRRALFKNSKLEKLKLGSVLRDQIEHNIISASVYHGKWMDIGTPERLQQLRLILKN